MDPSERLRLLEAGSCLTEQGTQHAKPGELQRWGWNFEFYDSPVTNFALKSRNDCVAAALDLGACPFAKDIEDDSAFTYAFHRLSNPKSPTHATTIGAINLLRMCWAHGAELLNPDNPRYLGDRDANHIRYEIAHECYSSGAQDYAREAGIPLDASWLWDQAPFVPLLRPQMIQWGSVESLREFAHAGFDFTKDIPVMDGEPDESLWLWLEDDNPDPMGVANFLLSQGNDPRVRKAFDLSPLEIMSSEPRSSRVASSVAAQLLSQDEQMSLSKEVRSGLPSKANRPKGI